MKIQLAVVFTFSLNTHVLFSHSSTISTIVKQAIINNIMHCNSLVMYGLGSIIYPTDTRESIAKTISVVPGYGPPDIYYPSYFLGEWLVTNDITTIVNDDTYKNQPSMALIPYDQPKTLTYKRRYINYNGNIVLDRSFSETNYQRKYLNDENAIATWDITNPNNLNVLTSSNAVCLINLLY